MTTKEKMMLAIDSCLDTNGPFTRDISEQDKRKKYQNYLSFKDQLSGSEGFLYTKDDIFIVVFAGSNEKEDWKTNFTYNLQIVPYDNYDSPIRAHKGYIEGYKRIREIIHEAYKGQQEVIITGYSMGGALATLCAVDIQYNFNPKDLLSLPGGAPKVFNKAGAESYNKRVPKTYRLVYGNDIVPELPPFCNWHHVDTLIHVGPKRGFLPLSIKDHTAVKEIIKEVENLKL